MKTETTSHAISNRRRFRAVSYALVFMMMACLALTVSILIHSLTSWHAGIIAGVLLFIVIDRLYTHRQFKSLTPLSSEWAIALGTQWIVIILFTRFLLSYAGGPDALRQDLSLFARGYIAQLLTLEFLITLLLACATWLLTRQFLELLDEIGLDMKMALQEEAPPVQSGVIPAHTRMVTLIFSTGILLVILTALTRLNVSLNPTGIPVVGWNRFSGAEAGALLYFVFGLALLSLSRLMSLQTHWNRLRIPVSSSRLPEQWAMYSLFFLLLVGIAVSLLPAGDSPGFFSILRTLFGFVLGILFFLAQLILALLLFLLTLPFLLFGQLPPAGVNADPPPLPVLPTQPVEQHTASLVIPELLRSILLWGTLIVILVYALTRFVKQHESVFTALRRTRLGDWLARAWGWLYRNLDAARGGLSRALTDGWQQLASRLDGKRVLPRPGWIRLRSLDPRRRIYFFYLAMIRRGSEQGLTRGPSQTPAEYAATLEKEIPSAGADIDSITQAFVEARYSRREVHDEDADLAKWTWERIRRALRRTFTKKT